MCEKKRCRWAAGSEEMIRYHDQEWGTPQHVDAKLFELFLLEGFQAGLSWAIVLKKREAFRRALDGFDAEKIAAYSEEKIQSLLQDESIIRSERKLRAAVTNAQTYLRIRQEFGLKWEPLLILAIGRGIEKIELVPIGADGDRAYYREGGTHYVPKVRPEDLTIE